MQCTQWRGAVAGASDLFAGAGLAVLADPAAEVDLGRDFGAGVDLRAQLAGFRSRGKLPQVALALSGVSRHPAPPSEEERAQVLRKLAAQANGGDVAALLRSFESAQLVHARELVCALGRDVKYHMSPDEQGRFIDDMHQYEMAVASLKPPLHVGFGIAPRYLDDGELARRLTLEEGRVFRDVIVVHAGRVPCEPVGRLPFPPAVTSFELPPCATRLGLRHR